MSVATHLISSHLPSIKQLQCFLAVAHELNFRRAAERLSMTQPPLTRQIQSLEGLLGQALFDRNTHAVTLTHAGQALVGKAEAILSALSALKQEAQPAPSRVRIGLTRTLNIERIAPLSRQLAELHARDEIEMPADLSPAVAEPDPKQPGSGHYRRKRIGEPAIRMALPRATAGGDTRRARGQPGSAGFAGDAG